MWKRIRRRVWIGNGLHFDYEVSPHRAFLANMPEKARSVNVRRHFARPSQPDEERSISLASVPAATRYATSAIDDANVVGNYVPFKQSRLKGQANPLRPPLHVETVLIGRALGQPTGYLFGVGYRIDNDGHVEAEFADGIRVFDTHNRFKTALTNLIERNKSS